MALAGHQTTVKLSGTSTAFTGAATTNNDPGTYKEYQLTDTTKRRLDPAVAPTVKKNGVAQAATLYTVNYLFGKVTFASGLLVTDVVTIDGSYLPTHSAVEARGFSINESVKLLGKTVFSDTAENSFAGQKMADGSLEQLDLGTTALDGGTLKLKTLLDNSTPKLLEIRPAGTGDYFCAWVLLEQRKVGAPAAERIDTSFTWKLAPQMAGTQQVSFGWGT